MSCAMDLAFPACASGASLLTTVIFVTAAGTCYEEDYVDGCTMPNTTDTSIFRPVYLPAGRKESALQAETILQSGAAIPPSAKTIHVDTAGGNLTVSRDGALLLPAKPGVFIDTLTIAASDVTVRGISIETVVFKPNSVPGKVHLQDVAVARPIVLVPTPEQHTLQLDGARFENIVGGSVALFRHTGTVKCVGPTTRCFVLSRGDPGETPGATVAEDGATIVDLSAITATFGQQYLISFFAFSAEEALAEANWLVSDLLLPTIIAVSSVFLSEGTRISSAITEARKQ